MKQKIFTEDKMKPSKEMEVWAIRFFINFIGLLIVPFPVKWVFAVLVSLCFFMVTLWFFIGLKEENK